MIIIFGSISSIIIPYLNHFYFQPLLNFEVEKWFDIGMWMAFFGIYLGMCFEKSKVFGVKK